MSHSGCPQDFYRARLVADALEILERARGARKADQIAMREGWNAQTTKAAFIDAMLDAVPDDVPSDIHTIIARVAGLNIQTAKKAMVRLRNRGLVKEVGWARASSGMQRKLWLRAAE